MSPPSNTGTLGLCGWTGFANCGLLDRPLEALLARIHASATIDSLVEMAAAR
jgi:hypothetical protein